MLAESLTSYGAGRSILVDKHGVIIAGNKTLSAASEAGLREIVIVPTDGTRLVAVQRMDLDLSQDAKAKQLAIADNRIAEVGLEWDRAELQRFPTDQLAPFFTASELRKLQVAAETSPATDSLTKGEFLRFDFVGLSETGKTSIWNVIAIDGGVLLGSVRWHSPWRKYAFMPNRNADLVFEQICLRDLAEFCESQTALRRQKGEPPLKIDARDVRLVARAAPQQQPPGVA